MNVYGFNLVIGHNVIVLNQCFLIGWMMSLIKSIFYYIYLLFHFKVSLLSHCFNESRYAFV